MLLLLLSLLFIIGTFLQIKHLPVSDDRTILTKSLLKFAWIFLAAFLINISELKAEVILQLLGVF